jgi:hypothetical protein
LSLIRSAPRLERRVAVVEIRVAKLDVRVETVDEQVRPAQPVREVLALPATHQNKNLTE